MYPGRSRREPIDTPRTGGLEPAPAGIILGMILVVLVVLVARLLSLQVFGSQEWIDLAIENYTKNISIAGAARHHL